jgi:hypothetical protein
LVALPEPLGAEIGLRSLSMPALVAGMAIFVGSRFRRKHRADTQAARAGPAGAARGDSRRRVRPAAAAVGIANPPSSPHPVPGDEPLR